MKYKLLLATIPLCICFLMGCGDHDVAENEVPPVEVTQEPWLTALIGQPDNSEPAGGWFADRQLIPHRIKLQNRENMAFYRAAVVSADNWQDADGAVRKLLAEKSEVPQYIREQTAAQVMLRKWFSEGETTTEQQEALGYYTSLLIDNNNPQARTVEDALVRLEGYWDDQQIAEAAAKSAKAAEAYLAKQSEEEPMQPTNEVLEAHVANQERQAGEITSAAKNLEAKAKR